MPKNVLIVDDDRILLSLTEKKLRKHASDFEVLTAENGLQAVSLLKTNPISLVVTDLHMPHMDGFAFLAHLSDNYPDIPVIILTAYGTPDSKKVALEAGAAEYLEKPFVMEELAQKIIASLERESEGGILQTVPLEIFLQLVEMEQKTCTIRVTNKISGLKGVLFFRNGELYDARVRDAKGLQSVHEMLSWSKVALAIQDTCPVKVKQIDENLQAVLLEAMRLRDEAAEGSHSTSKRSRSHPDDPKCCNSTSASEISAADTIRSRLEKLKDEKKWLKEIFYDDQWNRLTAAAADLGKLLDGGQLKSCYVSTGESVDYILLPAESTIVISTAKDCPHDRMMQILSE